MAAVMFMSEDILFAACGLGVINTSPSPHGSTRFQNVPVRMRKIL